MKARIYRLLLALSTSLLLLELLGAGKKWV
jgi:hypothetical protein